MPAKTRLSKADSLKRHREQITEWQKAHPEKVRQYAKGWRQRIKDKLKRLEQIEKLLIPTQAPPALAH
jgi:hypothetical protein